MELRTTADQKFPFGRLLVTPGAAKALNGRSDQMFMLLRRHIAGDWGDLDDEDKKANDEALVTGGRILSAYHTKRSVKVWIITEADRSSTTILLPGDY